MRIYEIAKEIGMSSKDVLAAAKRYGLKAKSPSSMLLPVETDTLVSFLNRETCCWCDLPSVAMLGDVDPACWEHRDKYALTYL